MISNDMLDTDDYHALVERITLNTVSTKDLILDFYNQLQHYSVSYVTIIKLYLVR